MTHSSAVLLVITSLCTGAGIASLVDSMVSKRKNNKNERRASVRLTLFFLFSSCIIVIVTCLVLFTPFLKEYIYYTAADYLYLLVFVSAGFFSALWYKTFFPLVASVYIVLFLSFSYFFDKTCLSYTAPVLLTFEQNRILQGQIPVPIIHLKDENMGEIQKTGYLVIQEYKLPAKLIIPLHRNYYRLVLFSYDRVVQDDFAKPLFSPVSGSSSLFFQSISRVLKPIYTFLHDQDAIEDSVFFFIELQLAEFHPYVFTFQPVESKQGFSYILDKLL